MCQILLGCRLFHNCEKRRIASSLTTASFARLFTNLRKVLGMPPDVVQIGPLVISKTVIDVLAALIGTLIGGFIAYLSTRAIEDRRWKQQKQDKLQDQRREALALMLEWLEPIGMSLSKAIDLVELYERRNLDKDALDEAWPDLLSVLATKAIPIHLKIVIPTELYNRGYEIQRGPLS